MVPPKPTEWCHGGFTLDNCFYFHQPFTSLYCERQPLLCIVYMSFLKCSETCISSSLSSFPPLLFPHYHLLRLIAMICCAADSNVFQIWSLSLLHMLVEHVIQTIRRNTFKNEQQLRDAVAPWVLLDDSYFSPDSFFPFFFSLSFFIAGMNLPSRCM